MSQGKTHSIRRSYAPNLLKVVCIGVFVGVIAFALL
jgi:hypothetical protein